MVQMDDTVILVMGPVLVAAHYAHRALVARYERRRELIANCVHDLYREGGPYCRTEKCRKCPHQRPIKMTRCPKCCQWSDAE